MIGPIIGGYIGKGLGWRWCFWIIAILSGILQIFFVAFLRETYSVQILKCKAEKLRKETQNPLIQSKYKIDRTPAQLFGDACIRPLQILFTSPILFMLSLYVGVVYGYLYLIMTTITEVFERVYGFSEGSAGLTFIGLGKLYDNSTKPCAISLIFCYLGVGCVVGVFFCQATLDIWVKRHMKDGQIKPEQRLPPVIFGGLILPVSLFMYGWTIETHTQWMAPIIATAILSLGLVTTLIPVQSYLVDAFGIYSASAVAGLNVLRNLGGTFFPLAGPPLNNNLGVGWASSVLGFIALAFVPVPLLLMRYGEALRSRDKRRFEQ